MLKMFLIPLKALGLAEISLIGLNRRMAKKFLHIFKRCGSTTKRRTTAACIVRPK
jgi:hypothetical protein